MLSTKLKNAIKKPLFQFGPEVDIYMTKLVRIKNRLMQHIMQHKGGTGGTTDADYCLLSGIVHYEYYSLVAENHKLPTISSLNSVAEFGCGDTYATVVLFYIFGAKHAYGIDPHPYVDKELTLTNVEKIEEILLRRDYRYIDKLILQRPHFCQCAPKINTFERFITNWKKLSNKEISKRATEAKASIKNNDGPVRFFESLPSVPIDFLFSVAVMEHPEDLQTEYKNLARKTRFQAHMIDCKSHDSSLFPLGHFRYSNSQRYRARSPYPYLRINGVPQSDHKVIWKENNLKVLDIVNNYVAKIKIPMDTVADNINFSEDESTLSDYYVFLESHSQDIGNHR